MINGMEMKEKIGTGAFGSVHRVIQGNKSYACKKVSKALLLSDQKKVYFNNEIFLLKQLNHSNIVRYVDQKESFSCYYLILEYFNGGTLLNALNASMRTSNAPLSEDVVRYLTKQILEGLVYLSKMNIIHRDIKAENILLHFDSEEDRDAMALMKAKVKIIDFGFARYLQKDELALSIIGTPLYMDPSILSSLKKDKVVYSEKCDIWSLGILAYQLLIGVTPFQGSDVSELYDNVTKFNCNIPNDIKLSNECVSFINLLLTVDESKRPSASELLNDPFIIRQSQRSTLLSLKSHKEKEVKHCFNDYWEEAVSFPISAMTTRKSLGRGFALNDSENEDDDGFVLAHTEKKRLNYKEIKPKPKKIAKQFTLNRRGNKKESSPYERASTPSQFEECPKAKGFTSFLQARSSLKKMIKS